MVVALILLLTLAPVPALAAEDTTSGSFTPTNSNPTVDAVGIYETDRSTVVTAMTPQTEYSLKVTVSDANTINDLDTVKVTLEFATNPALTERSPQLCGR